MTLFVSLAALLTCACSGGNPTDGTTTASPNVSPTATPTGGTEATATPSPIATPSAAMYYPSSTRTGIAQLDPVLDALFSGDVARFMDLFELTPSPCVVKPLGIHNPPACPEGVAPGTLLPVFRALAGEAVWPDDLEQVVTNWLARPHGLFAVYREPQISHSGWIPGAEFAIVLTDLNRTSEPWFASEIRVTDGRVVAIRFGGSLGAESYVEGVAQDRLISPPLPGWLAELPTNVQAVAAAVSAGDRGALVHMLHFRLPRGSTSGPTSIFLATHCEGGIGLFTPGEALDHLGEIAQRHGALMEAVRANEEVQTFNLVHFLVFRVVDGPDQLRTVVVDSQGVIMMFQGCAQDADFFAGNGDATIWR